jgi:hypothetical protein
LAEARIIARIATKAKAFIAGCKAVKSREREDLKDRVLHSDPFAQRFIAAMRRFCEVSLCHSVP